MNDDFELKFKDKEIERVTSELTKSGKQQFGASLKNAIEIMPRSREEVAAEANIEVNTVTPEKSPAPVVTKAPNAANVQEIPAKPASDFGTITMPAVEPATETKPTSSVILSEDAARKELFSIVKPLRTYERDVAETIRNKSESIASINLARQKKKEEEAKKSPVPQQVHKAAEKGLVFLVSIVLLFAGAGIIGFVIYYFSTQPDPIVSTEPTLISTDRQFKLEIDSRNPAAALLLVQIQLREMIEQNKLAAIQVFEKVEGVAVSGAGTGNEGTPTPRIIERPLSVETFFDLFAKNAPNSLIRALGTEWLFGFQNVRDNNEPFLFLTIAEFDNTFDGMLRWEEKIFEDFKAISNLSTPTAPTAPTETTETASSSTSISTTPVSTGPVGGFQDLVIRNKDTRVLRDNLGTIVLLYSFLDERHLVITTKEETFREILNRFFSSQVVR